MIDERGALRVGLIGCGLHGVNLAEAIRRTPSLRLVGCADPDDAAVSRVTASIPGVRSYRSLDSLLVGDRIDAVVIATPHYLLAPLSLAALRERKHVMAEKPIGITENEAAEIESGCG